jgi:hypothetical protein
MLFSSMEKEILTTVSLPEKVKVSANSLETKFLPEENRLDHHWN